MKFVTAPSALPGCCLLCRAGNNRTFYIDSEFNFDYYGAVYICCECLREAAEKAGYLTPETANKLKDRNDLLERQTYDKIREATAWKEAHDALLRGGFQPSPPSPPNRSIFDSVQVAGDESPEGSGDVGEGEGSAPEQEHDEGMAELRSDDDATAGSEVAI